MDPLYWLPLLIFVLTGAALFRLSPRKAIEPERPTMDVENHIGDKEETA